MVTGVRARAGQGGRQLRAVGATIAAVLVATAIVLAITGGAGGSRAPEPGGPPRLVANSELTALEGELGHPIYWAGERSTFQLELREEAEGSVYLRYLPEGVEAGDPGEEFLTVGTYPVSDAVGALQRTAAKAGVPLAHTASGGVVLPNPSAQGSVYLAYPGSDLQIEVYDPAPGRSLHLIRSGAIEPVG